MPSFCTTLNVSLVCSFWHQMINYGKDMTQCAQKCSSRMTIKPYEILMVRRVAYTWSNSLSPILQEGWSPVGSIHEVRCGAILALECHAWRPWRASCSSQRIEPLCLSNARLGEPKSKPGCRGKIKVSGIKGKLFYFLCYPYFLAYTKNTARDNIHLYIGFICSEGRLKLLALTVFLCTKSE